MGIGYFQLTVVNENDKYLIGNPQFTFFKSVYKRHTNFAKETVLLNFTGNTEIPATASFNQRFYATVPKNGDLVHKMYLAISLRSDISTSGVSNINFTNNAFSLIDSVEVALGDQVIDKHSGEWLHIYNELFVNEDKNQNICDMIDIYRNAKQPSGSRLGGDGMVYIPLNFWFNRSPGLALPLIALQYVDVRINLRLNNKNKILNVPSSACNLNIDNIQLLTEFIHLDTEEKLLFSSNQHEYLIEQLQYTSKQPIDKKTDYTNPADYVKYQHKFELPFNHPVKELLWVIQDDKSKDEVKTARGNHLFNFWRDLDDTNRKHQLVKATVSLNGNELFEPLHANYFHSVMKQQHHSGFGYVDLAVTGGLTNQYNIDLSKGSGIYCYSFALYPEDYQPSGTLNFSKLDKAELRVNISNYDQTENTTTPSNVQKYLRIYAVNYNILKIVSGSGGLLFQN